MPITYRIKAYTSLGLLKSYPFFEPSIAEDILFKSLAAGLDIYHAYLVAGNTSKVIYSNPKEKRSLTYTRSDVTDEYGIISILKCLERHKCV